MWNNNKHREKDIVKLLKKRDTEAMHEVYGEFAGYLAAVCSRYILSQEDQKDVLQDSFVKLFTAIDHFEYRGEGSLLAWASRIVVNESLKWLKNNNSQCTMEEEAIPDCPDETMDANFEEVPTAVIQEMIRQLPEGYRTVFNLYVFEEKSHKEIAELLQIKENSSASQFYRAKNILAKQIRKYKAERNGRTMD